MHFTGLRPPRIGKVQSSYRALARPQHPACPKRFTLKGWLLGSMRGSWGLKNGKGWVNGGRVEEEEEEIGVYTSSCGGHIWENSVDCLVAARVGPLEWFDVKYLNIFPCKWVSTCMLIPYILIFGIAPHPAVSPNPRFLLSSTLGCSHRRVTSLSPAWAI